MCKELFKKIIFNYYKCKKEYQYINIDDDFGNYIKLEEEIRNNEYDFKCQHQDIAKRFYLDFCVYKDITKFELYKEVLDAPFTHDNTKYTFVENFRKIQKVYFGLIKFREIVKRKIYPKQITFDIKMVDIDPNSKHSITICQNKKLYYFTICDLLNIIEHNLTSGDLFFITPRHIKNPYNNMVFSKSTLYNIYFIYKFNTMYENKTFDYFFDCNFDITTIKDTHYGYLLKRNIKHHIDNLSQKDLIEEIKKMIVCINRMFINNVDHINISDKFPNTTLVKAFKPFYTHFIQIKYSLTYHEYFQKLSIFKANIVKFIEYNPTFGRVIVRAQSYSNFMNRYEYHDKYIVFDPYMHIKNDFMNSHYVENLYSVYHMYENKFKCQNIVYNRILELGPHSYKYSGFLNNRIYRSPSPHDYHYDSDEMSIDSDDESEDIQFRFGPQTPDGSPPRSRVPSLDLNVTQSVEIIENNDVIVDNIIDDISGNVDS